MRRRLPDRRRGLCAAARRRAAAQAARAADDLSRGRRQARRSCCCMTTTHGGAADRRAGAPRRRTAGQRAAARRQRGHAGRARSDRGGFRLWRVGACASCCAQSRATTWPVCTRRIALAEPILAGLGFAARPRRHDRDRRSVRARRDACARSRRRTARRGRRASSRSAASATCCGLRCANCIARRRRRSTSSRCPKARRSAPSSSMSRAARCASSCVSACPTGALSDDPERPLLRFAEDACVQCGLCKATCPEKVITPQAAARLPRRDRAGARAQGGRAVPLHPLRQAVRRQEHDRARRRQARRQALDVPEFGEARST